MEWSEGADDELYPVAPLPAHERAWRHPSEIGHAQWTRTEPPLTIGRGLIAATTTLGGLLSVAVLWAMWPSAGGGVSAVSTAATAFIDAATDSKPSLTTSSVGLVGDTSTTAPRIGTAVPATSEASAGAPTTTALTAVPQSSPPPSIENVPADNVPLAAAVTVGDDVLFVTTANAVGERTDLRVSFGGGIEVDASVVLVDHGSGLALLTADPAAVASITRLTVGAPPDESTAVSTLGDVPTAVSLSPDADGTVWVGGWDATAAPEGAPLVDDSGALVGLCTHQGDGMVLVAVDKLADLRLVAANMPQAGWMGLIIDRTAATALTIGMVDPSGPAAAAGLATGDVIVAIDNLPVLTLRELDAALAGRRPGDAVGVTVDRGGTPVTVDVVLSGSTAVH